MEFACFLLPRRIKDLTVFLGRFEVTPHRAMCMSSNQDPKGFVSKDECVTNSGSSSSLDSEQPWDPAPPAPCQ